MTAKSIALIATFAALAIVLNAIRIPTFYWPGWFYTLSDIPVIIVFFIYGFKIGILVEATQIIGQEIFFPVGPGGLVVYPMGLLVVPLMAFGVYLAKKLLAHKSTMASQVSEKKITIYLTGFAVAIRGSIMPIVDFFVLYQLLLPVVLGRFIPVTYVMGLIPAFFIYNITSALYAVPIAYFISKRIDKVLALEGSRLL
jgi:riboflavin transporter FmnP